MFYNRARKILLATDVKVHIIPHINPSLGTTQINNYTPTHQVLEMSSINTGT